VQLLVSTIIALCTEISCTEHAKISFNLRLPTKGTTVIGGDSTANYSSVLKHFPSRLLKEKGLPGGNSKIEQLSSCATRIFFSSISTRKLFWSRRKPTASSLYPSQASHAELGSDKRQASLNIVSCSWSHFELYGEGNSRSEGTRHR